MALSADRKTPSRLGERFNFPVAAGVHIFQGAMVGIDTSGYVRPARAAVTTDTIVGRALENVDNTDGAAGDLRCECETGCFRWDNSSAGDAIALDDIGSVVFAVDDDQVSLTNGTATRSPAGYVVDVDSAGVWVDHRPMFPGGADGDLVAANNLSDVAVAATALANLGGLAITAERRNVVMQRLPLNADGTYRYVHRGPDAEILSLATVVDGATTTGAADVTLTASIGATPVTTGVVTIAGGSAAGTLDLAEPTADNVLTEGDILSIAIVDGSQVAVSFATLTIELANA